MVVMNTYEAKANLSQLIERALRGEEVVIARAGKPTVRLVAIEEKPKPKKVETGFAKGQIWFAPDFDDPIMSDEDWARWEAKTDAWFAPPQPNRKKTAVKRKKRSRAR